MHSEGMSGMSDWVVLTAALRRVRTTWQQDFHLTEISWYTPIAQVTIPTWVSGAMLVSFWFYTLLYVPVGQMGYLANREDFSQENMKN
jgi:hypothetical protein